MPVVMSRVIYFIQQVHTQKWAEGLEKKKKLNEVGRKELVR